MRCLVTGGTGLVGSNVVRLLLERGWQVAALIRPTSNPWRLQESIDSLEVIPGDLSNIHLMDSAIREFDPDLVFHMGWYGVSNRYRNSPEQITQNLLGSVALLQLVSKTRCRKWVGLGSQAEYGARSDVLRERLAPRPETTYGLAKLCSALLSKNLCEAYDIGFTWLRLLAVYGPADDPEHLIPYVILSLLNGQKPSLTGGEQHWDYLYIDDAAEAIYQAATRPRASGIYNLSSGEALAVREIVTRIRDLIDPSLPLGLGERPYQHDQVMRLQADIRRLRKAIAWAPSVSMSEGLERTVGWYREHRNQFRY